MHLLLFCGPRKSAAAEDGRNDKCLLSLNIFDTHLEDANIQERDERVFPILRNDMSLAEWPKICRAKNNPQLSLAANKPIPSRVSDALAKPAHKFAYTLPSILPTRASAAIILFCSELVSIGHVRAQTS